MVGHRGKNASAAVFREKFALGSGRIDFCGEHDTKAITFAPDNLTFDTAECSEGDCHTLTHFDVVFAVAAESRGGKVPNPKCNLHVASRSTHRRR